MNGIELITRGVGRYSARVVMKPAISFSISFSELDTRRFLIRCASVFSIVLRAIRIATNTPTDKRLNNDTAINTSISVTPASDLSFIGVGESWQGGSPPRASSGGRFPRASTILRVQSPAG